MEANRSFADVTCDSMRHQLENYDFNGIFLLFRPGFFNFHFNIFLTLLHSCAQHHDTFHRLRQKKSTFFHPLMKNFDAENPIFVKNP